MVLVAACLFTFSGCNDDSDGSGGSLGSTLTISGTITHYFDTSTHEWTDDYTHYSGDVYYLVDYSAIIDTDDTDDADLDLETGVPDTDDMDEPVDWGATSSNANVLLYSVEIENENEDSIVEGNFDVATNGVGQYYSYIYASAATTLTGETDDGGNTYTYSNLTLAAGWNQVICETASGTTFTYKNGTITGAKWTFME